jgi:hypothetical protein
MSYKFLNNININISNVMQLECTKLAILPALPVQIAI